MAQGHPCEKWGTLSLHLLRLTALRSGKKNSPNCTRNGARCIWRGGVRNRAVSGRFREDTYNHRRDLIVWHTNGAIVVTCTCVCSKWLAFCVVWFPINWLLRLFKSHFKDRCDKQTMVRVWVDDLCMCMCNIVCSYVYWVGVSCVSKPMRMCMLLCDSVYGWKEYDVVWTRTNMCPYSHTLCRLDMLGAYPSAV